MKKILTIAAILLSCCLVAMGQEISEEGEGIEEINNEAQIDSTLTEMNIYDALPKNVLIKQSSKVRSAVAGQVENNARKMFTGFRIRIYFDSAQNAREQSLSIMKRFAESHPDIAAYRSYVAPNFKVTVGNFRTRADAEAALTEIQIEYPSAFIVREKFKYPSLGKASEEIQK